METWSKPEAIFVFWLLYTLMQGTSVTSGFSVEHSVGRNGELNLLSESNAHVNGLDALCWDLNTLVLIHIRIT